MNEMLSPVVKPGEMIADKYLIEGALGAGGMGVVLGARHVDLDAPRAIKVPYCDEGGYQAVAERFHREARIAARLQGVHAVRVCDSGRLASGAPYIVMERLEGEDLGETLRRRRRLPIADAARHVAQACDAVAELHALGLVHLDLKPANLFVTRVDGASWIKVLDFGIARPSCAAKPAQSDLEGSAGYMAPEQARSSEPIGPQADVWALGVILYELVTGRLPFCADTLVATLLLTQTQDPAFPEIFRPNLPPELSDIILRCLEKSPARRFQSVVELREALAPFVANGGRDEDGDAGDDAIGAQVARARATATTRRVQPGSSGRLRRSAVVAAAWVHRAGALIARAPDPLHAAVALGVGALRRYGRVGRAVRTARAVA